MIDAQRLIQLPSRLQDFRDLPHRDGLRAHLSQPFKHRQFLFLTDAQRLIQLPSRLQDVRDPPHRDGLAPGIPQPPIEGQLHLARNGKGFIQIPQIEQQPAQLIDQGDAQLIGCFRVALEPGPDLHHPPAALGHRTGVQAPMGTGSGRWPWSFPTGSDQGSKCGCGCGCGQEGIHAAPPGPQVGRAAGGQGDRLPIQPEHQPGPGLGRQALPAGVEGFPAGGVKPARAADHMHHRRLARVVHQPGFQHRHIENLGAERQPIAAQSRALKHPVEGFQHLPPQTLIRRLHQQPLKRGPMDQGAAETKKVVMARPRQLAGFSQPRLFDREA